MQSSNILKFNPLQLQDEELFYRLIADCAVKHGVSYFKPGTSYTSDIEFEIAGDHPFLFRRKLSVPQQFRVDVVGKLIGDGGSAEVYQVVATLKPGSSQSSQTKRVIKMVSDSGMKNEYVIGQHVPHLHIQPPVKMKDDDEEKTAYIMRFIAGRDLYTKQDALSDNERLMVARNAAWALKEQVHDLGLVHKDIKAENMIVDDKLNVMIIDYGQSHLQSEEDKKIGGTLALMSPEVMQKRGSTAKADIFSMGLTLAELFDADENVDYVKNEADRDRKFSSMFISCRSFSAAHQSRIKYLLSRCSAINPDNRTSLQEIVDEFESIIVERKQEKARTRLQKQSLVLSHDCAVKSRAKLAEPQSDAANKLDVLLKCLRQDAAVIADTPAAVDHYVFMLRVDALMTATSKRDMLRIAENAVDQYHIQRMDFNMYYAKLTEQLETLAQEPASEVLLKARQCHQNVTFFSKTKLPMYEKTINGCMELGSKLDKRCRVLQYHLQQLQSQRSSVIARPV